MGEHHTGPLLEIRELTVEFPGVAGGWVPVVEDVSLAIQKGEVLGLVGESGSGKSVTASAALGLVPYRGGRVIDGLIKFDGVDVTNLSEKQWRMIRGKRVGMIFQEPIRMLNPAYTVGEQVAETVRAHAGLSRRGAWDRAVEMLERVEIANARQRAHEYPHMFSGGMCQRVMIAQALACKPDLLIADEPTTALDVTIQASILQLLRDLQDDFGIAVLLIAHDLAVIAEMADEIAVMYAGQIVETGPAHLVITEPRHPYTEALLDAVPTGPTERLQTVPGTVPSPGTAAIGCRFAPRCEHRQPVCTATALDLACAEPQRISRCARAGVIYESTAVQGSGDA